MTTANSGTSTKTKGRSGNWTRGKARARVDPPKHIPAVFDRDKTCLNWSPAERKQGLRQCVEIIQNADNCSRPEAIQKIADRFLRTEHTVLKWVGYHELHQPPPIEVIDTLRFELGIVSPKRRRIKPEIVSAALQNPEHDQPWPKTKAPKQKDE